MKTLREILLLGLWGASAVQMASYVWESCSAAGGWGSFPGVDTKGDATGIAELAVGALAAKKLAKKSGGSGIVSTIGKGVIGAGKFLWKKVITNPEVDSAAEAAAAGG